jgi:tetratricopeptide (TPR) repeat protein
LEDRRSELEALSSLGLAYMTLGDANHSRLYLERALDLSRIMGDRQAEAEALFLFGRLWRSQGDLDAAWSSMQLARGQFAAMGHRRSEMDACLWLGQLAFDKGDIELARDTLSIALDFFCEVDRQDRCGQTYALLARLAVVEGRLEDGRKLAEQAVNILEALSKEDIHLPLSTYLDCIHALQTLSDEQRATSLLQDAWVVLQERVDRIQDPIIRASYLDNVATHCEIVRMVEAGRPGE